MFEEVPGNRPRYARMLGRRVVLGPFVIGTGVLLAAIGGSVAVAATVITASNGGFSDIPPKLLGQSAPLAGNQLAPGASRSNSQPPAVQRMVVPAAPVSPVRSQHPSSRSIAGYRIAPLPVLPVATTAPDGSAPS